MHSFSIKNVFYDKMDLKLFYFHVMNCSEMFQQDFQERPMTVLFIKFVGLQHANLVKKDSSNGYFGKCFRGAILQQILPEVYLEPRQISKMEICKKIVSN